MESTKESLLDWAVTADRKDKTDLLNDFLRTFSTDELKTGQNLTRKLLNQIKGGDLLVPSPQWQARQDIEDPVAALSIVVTSAMPNPERLGDSIKDDTRSIVSNKSGSTKKENKNSASSKAGVSQHGGNRSDDCNGRNGASKRMVELVARDPNNKSISVASSIRSKGSTQPPGTEAVKIEPIQKKLSRSRLGRGRSRSPRRRSRSNSRRKREYSRRSRSPRHRPYRRPRSRSRSPVPRPISPRVRSKDPEIQRVEEFLQRTNNRPRRSSRSPLEPRGPAKRPRRSRSRSPILKRKINQIFNEKLALTADGKWTSEMETNFRRMEDEELNLVKEFEGIRRALSDKPEEHPKYSEEWTKFWEKKYQEIEAAGGDPEHYDYVPEWKSYWAKRVEVLFDLDYDAKLDAIRLKFGMDYESLHRLRLGHPEPKVISACVDPHPVEVKPKSVVSLVDEDFTARSMSISDGGHDEDKEKVKSEGQRTPAVTVGDVKAIWEMMTGQKMSALPRKSDVASVLSSAASCESDDYDLVAILQLMKRQELQLSFLAPQVNMYFQKAEEMELEKSKKSNALLEDKDFVLLLFQCRDKFNSLMKAGVVQQDVLKEINLSVFSLNLILDSPKCKSIRPRSTTSETPSLGIPTNSGISLPPPVMPVTEAAPAKEPFQKDPGTTKSVPLAQIIANYTLEQKIEIAEVLSTDLNASCRNDISEPDLVEYVREILESSSQLQISLPLPTNLPSGSAHVPLPPQNALASCMPGNNNWRPGDNLITNRAVGTALPLIPTMTARAASPPVTAQRNHRSAEPSFEPVFGNIMGDVYARRDRQVFGNAKVGQNHNSSTIQMMPPSGPSMLHPRNPGFQDLTENCERMSRSPTPPEQGTPLLPEGSCSERIVNATEEEENDKLVCTKHIWQETCEVPFTLPFTIDSDCSSISSHLNELPELPNPNELPPGIREMISKERRRRSPLCQPNVVVIEKEEQTNSSVRHKKKKRIMPRKSDSSLYSVTSIKKRNRKLQKILSEEKNSSRHKRKRRKKKHDDGSLLLNEVRRERGSNVKRPDKRSVGNSRQSPKIGSSRESRRLSPKIGPSRESRRQSPKIGSSRESESRRVSSKIGSSREGRRLVISDKKSTIKKSKRRKRSSPSGVINYEKSKNPPSKEKLRDRNKRKKPGRPSSVSLSFVPIVSTHSKTSGFGDKEKLRPVAQMFWEDADSSISSKSIDHDAPSESSKSISGSQDRNYRIGVRRPSATVKVQVSDPESGELLSSDDVISNSDTNYESNSEEYLSDQEKDKLSEVSDADTAHRSNHEVPSSSRKKSISISPREEITETDTRHRKTSVMSIETINSESPKVNSLAPVSDAESGEL